LGRGAVFRGLGTKFIIMDQICNLFMIAMHCELLFHERYTNSTTTYLKIYSVQLFTDSQIVMLTFDISKIIKIS
jgi:hypothetical protein